MASKTKNKHRRPRVGQLTMSFVRVARPGKRLGRKRSKNSGVWHVKRPAVKSRIPMLVTLKICAGLSSLRQVAEAEVFFDALRRTNREHAIRIVCWTLQGDHIHMIVEGDDDTGVSRALQGLCVRLSRQWNKLWNRTGKVFADRYHRVDLSTPTQVRNALRYVFTNFAKHSGLQPMRSVTRADGTKEQVPYVDHYFSSALYFHGWREAADLPLRKADDVSATPTSWLLRQGHLKAGPRLSIDDRPRS